VCDDTARALQRAAGLHEHAWLARSCGGQRREERPAINDALQVTEDHTRVGIVGERGDHIRLVHVCLVAEAGEEREAEVMLTRPVEDRGAQCA
jgi:hypothetical protein